MMGGKGLIQKRVPLILAVLFIVLAFSLSFQLNYAATKQTPEVSGGYQAVCCDSTAFVAVGTKGRMDRIKPDKSVTRLPAVTTAGLNGVVSMKDTLVAVGDGGVVLYATDGSHFNKVNSGTTKSLSSVAVFRGSYWAAGAGGTLLRSSDGKLWTPVKSGIKDNILSIAANDRMCMAVTRESRILMSADGDKWTVLDYNAFYKGCSEPCSFRSVRACGDVFFIAGRHLNSPGSPAILSSDTGEIWREHALIQINNKAGEESYPLIANAVAVDGDQLLAACNAGKLLTVTECSVCNKLEALGDRNINDLVSANGYLALVGDGFWYDIRKNDAFRQYAITAAQARMDFNNGAYIVDVRTEDEYAKGHIKGCKLIPVDKVEAELEKEIPDKSSEIIFYCAKGVRAQKALEKSLQMGYKKVYNLGGIGDWPYETETGSMSDRK